MNSRFEKYLKSLQSGEADQAVEDVLSELHRSFASLSQDEQKFAELLLHDIQSGNLVIESSKTFRDCITEYQARAKNREVDALADVLDVDKSMLLALMNTNVNQNNLNEYGRFDDLTDTVDFEKAKVYLEQRDKESLPPFRVKIRVSNLLKDFIIQGGFEI